MNPYAAAPGVGNCHPDGQPLLVACGLDDSEAAMPLVVQDEFAEVAGPP